MAALVSIGEFARLTHLSVKALRHYHDVGVLEPADIDPVTGYRRYDVTQIHTAQLVRRLRQLELPLDGVKAVIAAADPSHRDAVLAEHLQRMEQELARTSAVVASLRELLQAPLPPFDVEQRVVADQHALAIRALVEANHVEEWSIAVFGALERAVAASAEPAGPPGSLFSAEFFTDGEGEVIAFQPVTGVPDVDPGEPDPPPAWDIGAPPAVESILVAGGHYAEAVHRGPYLDLDRTYGALGGYVADRMRPAVGRPIRERYVIGPDQVEDPKDLRTGLLWPIEVEQPH